MLNFYFLFAGRKLEWLAAALLLFALAKPTLAAPPSNDEPAGATSLTLAVPYVPTSGTTLEATPSAAPPADGTQLETGGQRADVFYKFTATGAQVTLTVAAVKGSQPVAYYGVITLYTFSAGAYTQVSQNISPYVAEQLATGQTYYVRVQTCYRLSNVNQGSYATFSICAQVPPPSATFAPVATYPATTGGYLMDVALSDVNNDTYLDVVVANDNGLVGVLLNKRNGTFGPLVEYPVSVQDNVGVALGDVNADGFADVVTANQSDGTAGLLLNKRDGTFDFGGAYSTDTVGVKPYGYSNHSSPKGVALSDVNKDGALDIVTVSSVMRTAGVLLNKKDGTFAPIVSYPTGPNSFPWDVVAGDLDGDGYPDMVVANNYQSEIEVLLNKRNGLFSSAVPYGTGQDSYPLHVAIGDVNKDGHPDVVTANYATSGAGVLLNKGNGTFAPVVFHETVGLNPNAVALGDMNGDGYPDIVLAGQAVNVLFNSQDGNFTLLSIYAASGGSLAVGDVNKDGRPDLVTTNSRDRTIGVLLNTTAARPLASLAPAVLAEGLRLYPNPAQATTTVLLPAGSGAGILTLHDALGRLVSTHPTTGPRYELNLRDLMPGVYVLQVQVGSETCTRRLLVE